MIWEWRIIEGETTDWWVTRGTFGQISSWPWGKDVCFSFILIFGLLKVLWFLLQRTDLRHKESGLLSASIDWSLKPQQVLLCCASESKKVCDQRIKIFFLFFFFGWEWFLETWECGGFSLSLKFLSFLVSRVRMWPFAPGSMGSDCSSSMSFLATLWRCIGLEIFGAPWNLFGN